MKLLICEHLAKPIKGRRADFLLLSKPDERVLVCAECYDAPGAHSRSKLVSQRYFDALVTEMNLLQKRQAVN